MYHSHAHNEIQKLVDVYQGRMPEEFMDYFPDELHTHLINMIRLSWDDHAAMTGKVFPVYLQPDNNTQKAQDKAELVESIAYGYNDAGRKCGSIGMDRLMKIWAWWLMTGEAVGLVLPSFQHKTPFFTFRNPMSHYPPVGWNPWNQGPLDNTLFAYQDTIGEIKRKFPHAASQIDQAYNKRTFALNTRTTAYQSAQPASSYGNRDDGVIWVGEYYTADGWFIATLEDQTITLLESHQGLDKTHPGVMPAVSFALYSPESSKGRSPFSDQISIQAAMSRMFSQKLDWYDKTLFPILFTTPLAQGNAINIGPMAVNVWEPTNGINPNVQQIAPQNPIDADEMLNFSMGLSRMLNRNPEFQQGMGEANSAKALEGLRAGVNQTVQDGFWPSFLEGLPKLYAAAASMDIKLWGMDKKKATGTKKNTPFRVNYTPINDLAGYEHDIVIEPGLGLGGYQGTLELLQLVGAEVISEDTMREQMPGIREPQKEKLRVHSDRMEKLIWADLQQKAAQGTLQPGAMFRLHESINKGKTLFESIADLEEAGVLYIAPPQPEEMMGGPGGPAPSPEEMMMALGAGGDTAGGGNMPPLRAIRGGR